jgi:hypothetical protein
VSPHRLVGDVEAVGQSCVELGQASMKSRRHPDVVAAGDGSTQRHQYGPAITRVIPPSPAPSRGRRTPPPRHRCATPYGLRSATAGLLHSHRARQAHRTYTAIAPPPSTPITLNRSPGVNDGDARDRRAGLGAGAAMRGARGGRVLRPLQKMAQATSAAHAPPTATKKAKATLAAPRHKPVTQHETSNTGAPATHQPLHSTNRPAAQSAGRKG